MKQIPKWTRADQLFPAVPWLLESDFDEGRRALWEVDYGHDLESLSCWPVTTCGTWPSSAAYLTLHASRGNGNDGGRITMAIHPSPHFDVYAKEVFAMQHATPRAKRFWWKDDREDGA